MPKSNHPPALVTKKGRPIGAKNKTVAEFRDWQPKKWKFDYETVLLLHLTGKSYEEIGEITQFTPVHVGNILNSELCKERIEKIKEKLGVSEVIESYKRILELMTSKLVKFAQDDELYTAKPFMYIDRAMKAMEMMNAKLSPVKTADINNGTVNHNTMILASEDSVKKLLAANDFSKRMYEIHGVSDGTVQPNTVNEQPERVYSTSDK